MRVDHLIIGGGIAGATAAETIRQRDPRATIRIIGAERHPVYSRVLLPHVADGRAKLERVVIRTAAALEAKGIAYDAGAVATAVDARTRAVTLADGTTCTYGKLLIASGSDARRFAGPGAEHCSYFRTLDDLHSLMTTARVGAALVYGGGFNAIDLAVSLARRGARVACVMRSDGFLARSLDAGSREAIRQACESHGVTVTSHRELRAVERKISGLEAHYSDGGRAPFDLVGVSLGVVPNVGFLAGSGIAIASGVVVDEKLRAAEDVYAAGDVAEYLDARAGAHRIAGNWMNAMFQGKTAGMNMTGADAPFDLVTSYSIACFELPITFMGAVDAAVDERVVRPLADAGTLQLFLKGERIIAATCVGPFSDRAAVSKFMSSGTVLSASMRKGLSDPRTELANMVP
ncbi:MAG TPA: FAD-dependent oxidoreductase [Candidatus Binatia bacterium]|jgi:NAD(P)H-nitrite reductase large subunit|nr:FAD-dependent oxidoreductase [Candidatus Binatia bacterium]